MGTQNHKEGLLGPLGSATKGKRPTLGFHAVGAHGSTADLSRAYGFYVGFGAEG